jgi:outer membrane protein
MRVRGGLEQRPRALVLLAAALIAAPARAADLLQIYRDALANDATYASARATRDAGLENLPQGLAQILPTINATGFAQANNVDITFRQVAGSTLAGPAESQRSGPTSGFTVTLTQPLFNWQNFQVYNEAGFKAAQAEALFGQATQDLIVRVAQAYFDVLASQDSLTFIQGQKVAIAEQLAQAKRNFEVGTATITDTHEAQARFDLATSQEIAAQSDLEIKKRTLQQIVGTFPEQLAPLKP